MFSGAFTAIVTPFKDGQVDEKAFKSLIGFGLDGESADSCPVGPLANPLPCLTKNTTV